MVIFSAPFPHNEDYSSDIEFMASQQYPKRANGAPDSIELITKYLPEQVSLDLQFTHIFLSQGFLILNKKNILSPPIYAENEEPESHRGWSLGLGQQDKIGNVEARLSWRATEYII